MTQLPAGYFAALAGQLAFLSAVLGGFAVTFLGTLLAVGSPRRVVSWAIGSAGVSAASFICSSLAASFMAVATHPEAIESAARAAQSAGPRAVVGLTLMVGIYSLMLALSLSGWARSRRVGIVTTVAGGLAAILCTWIFAF